MHLLLTRFAETKDGVFGRLGKWLTIEEENQGNRANISCIPTGTYRCDRTMYHKGGYPTFEVMDVPGRTRILFHLANTEENIEGCIGLGSTLGVLRVKDEDSGDRVHKLAVLRSRDAFDEFMELLSDRDVFYLTIEGYSNTPLLPPSEYPE